MKKSLFLLAACFSVVLCSAQQKPAYVLYNAQGKKVSYTKMIAQLSKQDVVLIGEFHNNPISHWMELSITTDCAKTRKLDLGAEMFEQDNQAALDAYLAGKLSPKGLDSAARLWKNYNTDYAPLVDFAKENKLTFTATNIPRKYASLVSKGGFEALDTLSTLQKSWFSPLPISFNADLPGYKNILTMMVGHGTINMVKAQASKDATMAHFILKTRKPNHLFIHYNGSYHSDNYEGIGWYLKQAQATLKVATVTTVSQKDLGKLLSENKNKADYIICVAEDMTTTY